MARQPRVYMEGILYYVTSKSGHTFNLFDDASDYNEYIGLISKYKQQYGFNLFSYVLMPKHVHMLIELKNNVPISDIMHNITSLYTKLYNSKYSKKGHLFQNRFRAVLAEKETYMLDLVKEINLHPENEKLIADSKEYPYSSFPQFIDPVKRAFPDIKEEIQEVFGALNGSENEFKEFMGSADKNRLHEIEMQLKRRQILGSDEFSQRIKRVIEKNAKDSGKNKQDSSPTFIYMVLGATVLAALAVTSVFFYRGSEEFKSKYYKTLAMYEGVIDMLESEKGMAIDQQLDTEDYDWKINLARQALEEHKREMDEKLKKEKILDGFTWKVELKHSGTGQDVPVISDNIVFKDNKVVSQYLKAMGFKETNYSRRVSRSGVISWETIQRDGQGSTAQWRGDWDGDTMRGVMVWSSAGKKPQNFSFISVGERIQQAR